MALWKVCAGQAFRLRELVATLGKQSAEVRIAAFIVGMYRRLTALGRVAGEEMPFPLRQKDIADILGLTQVHVSRMLKLLKDKNLIQMNDDRIRLLDAPTLARIGQV
jgi:CRP-like cAMP-binding protein